ncbi:TrmH family RNA methyltransferase [Streptacidiphilus albus]|uniref:TrmH family RNA methyltransferase n=1 Tax=Streptacidiphilus albus TaxID=105425 RepID=UPI00157B4C40|nr:TrmH family RNA methyltransferase [Streptacidiphilus albus]
MAAVQRITSRNARFQQWQSLLTNRNKRTRAREFLVQGVRPITVAVERGWTVRAVLFDAGRPLSRWAGELLRGLSGSRTEQIAMDGALLAELGEKGETVPELIAVLEMPEDDLERIPVGDDFLGVLFDRPTNPGNIGSIIRSADAFGAHGLIVTGHAADVYDSKSVRASTGSLFALPAVRVPSQHEVHAWLETKRRQGRPVLVVGTDEHGEADVFDFDLTRPTLLLVGNETAGLSAAWRELCDHVVSIPMSGSASSLNAANAATAVLYEASRQRTAAARAARPTVGRPRSGTAAVTAAGTAEGTGQPGPA